MSENKNNCCHMTSIGGQAVMEGVMMRGPKEIATAVRKSSGEIVIDKMSVNQTASKLTKIPVLRGVINFFSSMVVGVKCLMFSADQMDLEEDDPNYKPSKFETWLENKLGDKIKDVAIYFSVIVAIFFSIGLFRSRSGDSIYVSCFSHFGNTDKNDD